MRGRRTDPNTNVPGPGSYKSSKEFLTGSRQKNKYTIRKKTIFQGILNITKLDFFEMDKKKGTPGPGRYKVNDENCGSRLSLKGNYFVSEYK
jgi:hypothetical protein